MFVQKSCTGEGWVSWASEGMASRGTHVIGFAVNFVDGVALVDGVLEGSGDRAAMSRFTEALERLATGDPQREGEADSPSDRRF